MDFDASAQVEALAKLPPEPPKPPERSAWGWVPRIAQAAAAGVAGSVADVVKGAAAADALTLGADPRARGAFNAEQLQAGQVEAQRQLDTGEAMTSTLGDSFRQVQRDARPDPVTAGTAERLVFGVAEPMLKLIGGGMTLGPFGLAGASAEIGLQQSDELRQQGVDFQTRAAVGALTAGVTAASVALPLTGPTLKATAGLYVAGGPGGYIAQQAATSEILKRAGYAKIAEQFDPLDPVGLAMSALIPLPFAAYGARRIMKAGKGAEPVKPAAEPKPVETVPPEAVDAAMVHNLTLQRQAQEAVPPVARAAEVMRGPVTENPNFKAWFGESKVVDETGKPMVVYHGTPNGGFDAFSPEFAGRGIDAGYLGRGTYLTDTPFVADYYATSSHAFAPTVMPVYASLKEPFMWGEKTPGVRGLAMRGEPLPGDLTAAVERRAGFKFDPNAEYDATIEQSLASALRDELIARGHDGVIAMTDGRREIVVFEPTQVKSAIGNSGDFNPASASLTDPRPAPPPTPKPDPAPAALAETIAKAQEELTAFQASGKTLDEFVAGKELPPAVNNLLIGLAETLKSPARTKALLDMVGKSDPNANPANATADAVERVRTLTDEQITNTEPATAPKAAPDALMQSVSERVAAVEMTNPDMVVGMTDSGNPITVRDELARIRKEAAEGTDTTLGAADADLVNVAANCALTNGG